MEVQAQQMAKGTVRVLLPHKNPPRGARNPPPIAPSAPKQVERKTNPLVRQSSFKKPRPKPNLVSVRLTCRRISRELVRTRSRPVPELTWCMYTHHLRRTHPVLPRLVERCPYFGGWYVQASMGLGPEDVSLLERCPHFRGWYVQASMELGPEDVSLLERCPHFRGWYVRASMELGPEDVSLLEIMLLSVSFPPLQLHPHVVERLTKPLAPPSHPPLPTSHPPSNIPIITNYAPQLPMGPGPILQFPFSYPTIGTPPTTSTPAHSVISSHDSSHQRHPDSIETMREAKRAHRDEEIAFHMQQKQFQLAQAQAAQVHASHAHGQLPTPHLIQGEHHTAL